GHADFRLTTQRDRVDAGALAQTSALAQLEVDRLGQPRLDAFAVLHGGLELRGVHGADSGLVESEPRVAAQDVDVDDVAVLGDERRHDDRRLDALSHRDRRILNVWLRDELRPDVEILEPHDVALSY